MERSPPSISVSIGAIGVALHRAVTTRWLQLTIMRGVVSAIDGASGHACGARIGRRGAAEIWRAIGGGVVAHVTSTLGVACFHEQKDGHFSMHNRNAAR